MFELTLQNLKLNGFLVGFILKCIQVAFRMNTLIACTMLMNLLFY